MLNKDDKKFILQALDARFTNLNKVMDITIKKNNQILIYEIVDKLENKVFTTTTIS